MSLDKTQTIMIFDSDCILCSRWVHFILAHERDNTIFFVSAWSADGRRIAAQHGLSETDLQRTYLVVENGIGYTRSDAGIVLAQHLTAPARWLSWFKVVPRPMRDTVYSVVARNRYKWFGRSKQCVRPAPENRHRFILD